MAASCLDLCLAAETRAVPLGALRPAAARSAERVLCPPVCRDCLYARRLRVGVSVLSEGSRVGWAEGYSGFGCG